LRSRGQCVRPRCHGYLFVMQQLTEVRPRCQDPGMAIYQIVLTGYIHDDKDYSPDAVVFLSSHRGAGMLSGRNVG
jgi:hypothetical protein